MFLSHEDMIATRDSIIKGTDAKIGVWSTTAQTFFKRRCTTVVSHPYRLGLWARQVSSVV